MAGFQQKKSKNYSGDDMRILHITATHLRGDGGIPTVLVNMVEEQNRIKDLDANVISLVADVKHIDSNYFKKIDLSHFVEYIKSEKPDVAIIHSFFYIEYAKVSSTLVKNGIKYYIEPHGSFMKEGLKKSRIKKTIANTLVFRNLIKKAYGYIYLCEGEMRNSVFHTKNDIIIPNGIAPIQYKEQKNNSIKLYYIGRYDIHEKGIDILLDALKILDKSGTFFELDFFGNGSEKSKKYIRDKIKQFKGITVRERGPIFGENKDRTLSQYNISLLLSRHEGLPMTILESWNYGNPCIVTVATNVSDEAQKNRIGWVTNFNPVDIAEVIKQAIDEYSSERELYVERCKAYIYSKYSWEKVARLSYTALSKKLNRRVSGQE